jgi:hypothetical protein
MVNSHLLYQLSYAGNAPFRGPKRYRKRADDVNAMDGPTRSSTSRLARSAAQQEWLATRAVDPLLPS